MPRMQVDAVVQGVGAERPALLGVRVVLEHDGGHLRGAGLAERVAVTGGLLREAVPEQLTHALHQGRSVHLGEQIERLDGRRQRRPLVPQRSGHEDGRGCCAVGLAAEDGRHRLAVGDRLAPGRQVRLDSQQRPARIQGQTQSGADIVQDERCTLGVADRARRPGEGRVGQLLVVAGVVLERRHHDAREVSRDRRGSGGQAVDVVVGVGRKTRVVLFRRSARHPIRPRL